MNNEQKCMVLDLIEVVHDPVYTAYYVVYAVRNRPALYLVAKLNATGKLKDSWVMLTFVGLLADLKATFDDAKTVMTNEARKTEFDRVARKFIAGTLAQLDYSC